MSKNWSVHKFGGTSVANAERIRKVSEILASEKGAYKAVVVSAMSGTTDRLIHLTELARTGKQSYEQTLAEIESKHVFEIQTLLNTDSAKKLIDILASDIKTLGEILRGVFLSRSLSQEIQDLISGYGELWSAQMLTEFLNQKEIQASFLDARKVLIVRHTESGVSVDWEHSKKDFEAWYAEHAQYPYVVITGYVARNLAGTPTTLGRNGSDYSASIFGALFKASEITIWTDVNGVLSADPRIVPDAIVLDSMSYQEATELAYFGAKVLHPSTMTPAIALEIPIFIRNTFNPQHKGTRIGPSQTGSAHDVRAVSIIQNIALMTVEGTGMIGVPGVAQSVFGALKNVNISVSLISQASSEQSICFTIPVAQAQLAKSTLEKVFYLELQDKRISSVSIVEPCGIIAAVGDAMACQPGMAAKFFGALARGGINIRAIAQGASERNISIVIDQVDMHRALRIVHSAFFLSKQTLSVGILGIGQVGRTLLSQLKTEAAHLRETWNLDLKIRAIANSKNMLLSDEGIALENWESLFEKNAKVLDVKTFLDHLKSEHLPHSVIIDCTADDKVSKRYPECLERGIHIISANKKANTDDLNFYKSLRAACKKTNTQFLYETNVGAGLPIINTLRELVQTGDKIEKVEGILSGTLSFLFNNFDGSKAFSSLVSEAQKLGYTEPDPREDLSGTDVARKLVILSREMGLPVELKDVEVENLTQYSDEDFAKMLEKAKKANSVLRYVGSIEASKVKVGIGVYPLGHTFSRVQGRDNIIAFHTQRYSPEALVVQGPGAGPAVTAAGVFADLLRLAHSFGGTL